MHTYSTSNLSSDWAYTMISPEAVQRTRRPAVHSWGPTPHTHIVCM